MQRREFLQAVGAALAVQTAAPRALIAQSGCPNPAWRVLASTRGGDAERWVVHGEAMDQVFRREVLVRQGMLPEDVAAAIVRKASELQRDVAYCFDATHWREICDELPLRFEETTPAEAGV